jgi:C4-dicarboxylate-specific signal transduction histidine kinase
MRAGQVRLLLVLDLAAAAVLGTGVLLLLGLPPAARGNLGPHLLVPVALASAVAVVAGGVALLFRAIALPVERLLASAARLDEGRSAGAELPVLSPPGEAGGGSLGRAAVAFERTTAALAEERARLAAKVDELERANRALFDAHETLARAEKLATVGRLAAGVAHEVGNPLGAIAGYAEVARERLRRGAATEADDFLDRIGAEARRIDAIVRDLLDFARPAGPELSAVELRPAVDAAVRLARPQPRFRDVEVGLELPAALPPVLADGRRLEQVLLNLLLNAGDAMGGRGRLEIVAREEGEGVEVDVLDHGPGFPEADLPRVFDPFFTTKAPGAGTGLGLSICHRILESFGGSIEAANRQGGGARLRLRLRRAR